MRDPRRKEGWDGKSSPKRREAMLRRWAPLLEQSRRIDRAMLAFRREGLSLAEIGRRFKVSRTRVSQRIKRAVELEASGRR